MADVGQKATLGVVRLHGLIAGDLETFLKIAALGDIAKDRHKTLLLIDARQAELGGKGPTIAAARFGLMTAPKPGADALAVATLLAEHRLGTRVALLHPVLPRPRRRMLHVRDHMPEVGAEKFLLLVAQ